MEQEVAALGQTIGYLALFAPGGIGPRDGIFFAALRVLYDPISASLIVPIRLVSQIVIDVTLALVGLLILRNVSVTASASATRIP